MGNTFFDTDESEGFSAFYNVKCNMNNVAIALPQLRKSLELLLKAISTRENITITPQTVPTKNGTQRPVGELENLIKTLCSGTNSTIPKTVWNTPKQNYPDNNFLHDIRTEGNKSIHTSTEKQISLLKGLVKNYNDNFIEWYKKKYTITDWENLLKTNSQSKETVEVSIDTVGEKLITDTATKTAQAVVSSMQNHHVNPTTNRAVLPPLRGSYINSSFWKQYTIKKENIVEELKHFYTTPVFSHGNMIEKVVANDFYILPNEDLKIEQQSPEKKQYKTIDEVFSIFRDKYSFKCLIKVTGLGGSGKTTFLWHLAKQYYTDYKTFFLDSFDKDSISTIEQYVNKEEDTVLILLDSVYDASKDSDLKGFFRKLDSFKKVFFAISERSSWLESIEDKNNFYSSFSYEFEVPFTNGLNRKKVFEKLTTLLTTTDETSFAQSQLSNKDNVSLVIQKYRFLKQLQVNFSELKLFSFDWEDWGKFVESHSKYSSLKHLYLFISAFQHLGQKIPAKLNFNTIFNSKENLDTLLNEIIGEFGDDKCPISYKKIENRYFVFTSDDMQGEILIKEELSKSQKNLLEQLLDKFFFSITDEESIYLFRNIHRVINFQQSDLFSKHLTYENRVKILSDYLGTVPKENYTRNESKCLTELIKTYEEGGDEEKMYNYVLQLIEYEKKTGTNFGKHMLANYYIDFNKEDKYEEAKQLLTEVQKTNKTIADSSFFKLYSKLHTDKIPDEWKTILAENGTSVSDEVKINMAKAHRLLKEGNTEDAILVYEDIIKVNPEDYHSRTKLSSILRKQANKASDKYKRTNLLNTAKQHLFIALNINSTNEHTYTELGETFFDLGGFDNTNQAIKYLKDGINNCTNNIGCRTSLGKIYRVIADRLLRQNDLREVESYLKLSFETLIEAKTNTFNHKQSSIELSITCMKYFELYNVHIPKRELLPFYKEKIEECLYPTFLTENGEVIHGQKIENGIRLLPTFYQRNNFVQEYNSLTNKILDAVEPYQGFWFALLDVYKNDFKFIQKLFANIIPTINDGKDIYKVVNKLTNPNYKIPNVSEPLEDAIKAITENDIQHKNGIFLLATYHYSLGDIFNCKRSLNNYADKISNDDALLIWKEFINVISENQFYINLSIVQKEEHSNKPFYFNEAKKLKQSTSGAFSDKTKDSNEIGGQIGYHKKLLEWQFGVTNLKSLNKLHESVFGYDNFYIYLVIGELYHRRRIPIISDEHRLKIAKTSYESAYFLAMENKFSYLEPSSTFKNSKPIPNNSKDLPLFYFERLINNMVDCYLNIHHVNEESIFIEKAFKIIENEKIRHNTPFYNLLKSKLFTRQQEYKMAYDACQFGLKKINLNATFNTELYKTTSDIKGQLLANLAYALHKNWVENKKFIGNKTLQSIKDIYQEAYSLSKQNWIKNKISEL